MLASGYFFVADTKGGGPRGGRKLSGVMSAQQSEARAKSSNGFFAHQGRNGTKK
jgi:hypothetical protein